MSHLGRRLVKLEHAPGRRGCSRCAGALLGVEFHEPSPTDYAERWDQATGERFAPPMPPNCPACGRRMVKVYGMPSRTVWDEIGRSV